MVEIGRRLYNKYIVDSAEFQINIPTSTRFALDEEFGREDVDVDAMMYYLNEAGVELKRLLHASFLRFGESDEFISVDLGKR